MDKTPPTLTGFPADTDVVCRAQPPFVPKGDLRVKSSNFTNGFIPDVTLTNEGADQIVEGIAVPQAW
jgi:hypothetical protein